MPTPPPPVIWLFGLSGSGKTTLAQAFIEKASFTHPYTSQSYTPYHLDGDVLRRGLTRDLSFTPSDRDANLERAAYVSTILSDAGVPVIATFITPYEHQRERIHAILSENSIPHVFMYIATPLTICERRDPKGLYARVRRGEIKNFTGIDDPFHEPSERTPYPLGGRIDTSHKSIRESLEELILLLNTSAKEELDPWEVTWNT